MVEDGTKVHSPHVDWRLHSTCIYNKVIPQHVSILDLTESMRARLLKATMLQGTALGYSPATRVEDCKVVTVRQHYGRPPPSEVIVVARAVRYRKAQAT
jgi:hypothetical protein